VPAVKENCVPVSDAAKFVLVRAHPMQVPCLPKLIPTGAKSLCEMCILVSMADKGRDENLKGVCDRELDEGGGEGMGSEGDRDEEREER